MKKVYAAVFFLFLLISMLYFLFLLMFVIVPKLSYITEKFRDISEESLTLMVNQIIFGKEHPKTLKSMFNLAYVLAEKEDAGSRAKAAVLYRDILEHRKRVYGKEHE